MCKESTSIDAAQLLAGREELQETDGEEYEFIDPNDISDDDDTEGDVTQGPLSTRHELTADAASVRVGLEWQHRHGAALLPQLPAIAALPVTDGGADAQNAMGGRSICTSIQSQAGGRVPLGCDSARLATAAG